VVDAKDIAMPRLTPNQAKRIEVVTKWGKDKDNSDKKSLKFLLSPHLLEEYLGWPHGQPATVSKAL
jgi:hypothetical protein